MATLNREERNKLRKMSREKRVEYLKVKDRRSKQFGPSGLPLHSPPVHCGSGCRFGW